MPPVANNRKPFLALFVALVAWGAFLSIGAYLSAVRQGFDARRGLVVAACVAAFLGSWALLLWRRESRRPNRGA